MIRPAGTTDEDGNWRPRDGRSTFTLVTRLPDGRKVMSSVEILDELMVEPMAGSLIVHNAKTAIECLLTGEQKETPK
jgi:hypothetical protein